MVKTTNANYLSATAPGNAFFSNISADSDTFARTDLSSVGSALDQHTHNTGLGLAVNTIPTGGLTVAAGGLTVTAGNVGIGIAAAGGFGLGVGGSSMTGTDQRGVSTTPTITSAATSTGVGIEAQVSTAAVAFTCANAYAIHALNNTHGAGASITSSYGILVDGQTAGSTNNYGIYINAPSGGANDNGQFIAGDTVLGASYGAGLATNATTGFVWIPQSAGAPTGAPNRNGTGMGVGHAAMQYDINNHKIWVYDSGWKGVVVS